MTPAANTKFYRSKAFIFDLDGTLIDTIPLVERHWHQFALENGLDGNKASNTFICYQNHTDFELDS